jgi:glycosyltransferase involved in cell wall biosynthesis
MKITFVTYIYPYPNRGFNVGIERVIQEFARELDRRGHEVHVITTYRNGGETREGMDDEIRIHRVSDARRYLGRAGSAFSLDWLSLNWSIRRYSNLIRSSDVIHAFVPIISKWFSTPLVTHYHHWDDPEDLVEYLYLPTEHRLLLRGYEVSDRVVAVSEYSADDLASRGIDREKIDVVYNGVDTSRFYPDESTLGHESWEFTLLYVGSITDRKGLHYLIRAMPNIVSENPDVGLLLVGGGDSSELESLVRELGVESHVEFVGFVPDAELPEYYRHSDLFVFPSFLEGFGMVIVEAMASGLPVVSTNATAIPEVVGDSGILVPPKDSTELANAVNQMLDDDTLYEFKERSESRIKNHFTWPAVTDSLENVYSNLE